MKQEDIIQLVTKKIEELKAEQSLHDYRGWTYDEQIGVLEAVRDELKEREKQKGAVRYELVVTPVGLFSYVIARELREHLDKKLNPPEATSVPFPGMVAVEVQEIEEV